MTLSRKSQLEMEKVRIEFMGYAVSAVFVGAVLTLVSVLVL